MSDQSNLCTRCNADNANRDSYFCADCERYATVNRLCNLAADDDGEVFFAACADDMAAAIARIESSGETTW